MATNGEPGFGEKPTLRSMWANNVEAEMTVIIKLKLLPQSAA
jgi:hypothetical protein